MISSQGAEFETLEMAIIKYVMVQQGVRVLPTLHLHIKEKLATPSTFANSTGSSSTGLA
jgi:hypothetical protein